jgi:hypothetical protein
VFIPLVWTLFRIDLQRNTNKHCLRRVRGPKAFLNFVVDVGVDDVALVLLHDYYQLFPFVFINSL